MDRLSKLISNNLVAEQKRKKQRVYYGYKSTATDQRISALISLLESYWAQNL